MWPQKKGKGRVRTDVCVVFSPPQVQQVFSSLESSPEPEEINLVDLTETLTGTNYGCSLLVH